MFTVALLGGGGFRDTPIVPFIKGGVGPYFTYHPRWVPRFRQIQIIITNQISHKIHIEGI